MPNIKFVFGNLNITVGEKPEKVLLVECLVLLPKKLLKIIKTHGKIKYRVIIAQDLSIFPEFWRIN